MRPHVPDARLRRLDRGRLPLEPILVDLANWSAEHDSKTAAPMAWIALMKADREHMIQRIRDTVQCGGAVFAGDQSLLSQLV